MKTRLAPLALAIALAGCTADNNASIRIQSICSPPDTCTFSSTCDLQYIGIITLDTAATDYLWLFLQVNNQLSDNSDPQRGKLNTNDAFVEEYVVEYEGLTWTDPSTGATGGAPAITGRLQSQVPAGGSAVVSVLPIPPGIGASASTIGTVVAKVRLKGKLGDEQPFETARMEIPIRICSGCVGVPTCTTGVPALCPPNPGQLPATASCG